MNARIETKETNRSQAIIVVDPDANAKSLIALAKIGGFRVVAVFSRLIDPEQRRPLCLATLDERLALDGIFFAHDIDKLQRDAKFRKILLRHRPRAVIPCTSTAAHLAAQLASRIGLPSNDPGRVPAMENLAAQRLALRAAGIAVPEFAEVGSTAQLEAFVQSHAFPMLLRAGGSGPWACRDATSLHQRFRLLMSEPSVFGKRASSAIVEQYSRGSRMRISIMARAGEYSVLDAHRIIHRPGQNERGHQNCTLQINAGQQKLQPYVGLACRCAQHLGLRLGVVTVELEVDRQGNATVVAVQTGLPEAESGTALQGARDFDLLPAVLALHVDGEFDMPAQIEFSRPTAKVCLPCPKSGIVDDIAGLHEVSKLPSFVADSCSVAVGDFVSGTSPDADSRVYVMLTHTDEKQLSADIKRALGLLAVTTVRGEFDQFETNQVAQQFRMTSIESPRPEPSRHQAAYHMSYAASGGSTTWDHEEARPPRPAPPPGISAIDQARAAMPPPPPRAAAAAAANDRKPGQPPPPPPAPRTPVRVAS